MKEIENDNNVTRKTPDEIKKGLNVLYPPSSQTTYSEYVEAIACIPDAIALIEQLEERNNRLEYTLMGVMHSVDKWLKVEPYDFDKDDGTEAATRAANAREIALKAIEQLKLEKDAAEAHVIVKAFIINRLERERDAAIEDIKKAATFLCQTCKKYHPAVIDGTKHFCDEIPADHFDDGAIACGMYEWQGVKDVERWTE